jgi:hypothetical protein
MIMLEGVVDDEKLKYKKRYFLPAVGFDPETVGFHSVDRLFFATTRPVSHNF